MTSPTGIKSDERFKSGGLARNALTDVRITHSRPLPDFYDFMSLEYAIEYPCEMRRLYGEQTLRALGRAGSLVSQIVNMTLKDDRPPSEESVRFTTELSEELEISERVAEYCRTRCPAHVEQNFDYDSDEDELGCEDESLNPPQGASRGETIGCLGRIRYPIEEGDLQRRVISQKYLSPFRRRACRRSRRSRSLRAFPGRSRSTAERYLATGTMAKSASYSGRSRIAV